MGTRAGLVQRLFVVIGGLKTTRTVLSRPPRRTHVEYGIVHYCHTMWTGGSLWRPICTSPLQHPHHKQQQRVHGMAHHGDDDETLERREKRLSRAKGAALGYIGRRSHSRKELEKKMMDRGHEADVIQESLDRMQDLGLQDDGEYALIFARSKWRQSKWSPRKIDMELRRRGVEEDVIDNALENVFGVEKDIQIDETYQEAIELLAAAKRQYQSYGSANISKEAKKRRIIGWLQRRGFTWDTIRSVLQSIEQDT